MIRKGLEQLADNFSLGSLVNVGDKVVATLLVDLDKVHALRRTNYFVASAACGTQGDIEHWFHRLNLKSE